MKPTANQIKTFFRNHPLYNAIQEQSKICKLVWNFTPYKEMEKTYRINHFAHYQCTIDNSTYPVREVRKNSLIQRYSKDFYFRFKDYQRSTEYEEITIFGFNSHFRSHMDIFGETEISVLNPLTRKFEVLKNAFNSVIEVQEIAYNHLKSLFFAKGIGRYATWQIELGFTKKRLIEAIKDQRDYKNSEYWDNSQDEYDFEATLKSLKRNLGLIFSDHLSMYSITEMVNKVGTSNKGKTPKKVYEFNTSFIQDIEDPEELESTYYSEIEQQGKNAILI